MMYDDQDPAQARQQKLAAMLGILSGNQGLSNFGKAIIGDQDEQQKQLHDAIAQNLQLGTLDQSAQQHSDLLAESIREHNMVDQRDRDLATERAQDKKDAIEAQLIDPDTIKSMAQQYLAGDKSVLQNLGRGTQGAQNIKALRQAISSEGTALGLKPADIAARLGEYSGFVAQQRTMGTQLANVTMASTEAQTMIDQARQASNDTAVSRAHALGWNNIEQWGEKQLQDPQLASLKGATTAVINTWARAINPKGVATVEDKKHGYDLLNAAQDAATYNAVLDRFEQEAQASLAAPVTARQRLHDAFMSGVGAARTDAASTINPSPQTKRIKVDAQGNVIGN